MLLPSKDAVEQYMFDTPTQRCIARHLVNEHDVLALCRPSLEWLPGVTWLIDRDPRFGGEDVLDVAPVDHSVVVMDPPFSWTQSFLREVLARLAPRMRRLYLVQPKNRDLDGLSCEKVPALCDVFYTEDAPEASLYCIEYEVDSTSEGSEGEGEVESSDVEGAEDISGCDSWALALQSLAPRCKFSNEPQRKKACNSDWMPAGARDGLCVSVLLCAARELAEDGPWWDANCAKSLQAAMALGYAISLAQRDGEDVPTVGCFCKRGLDRSQVVAAAIDVGRMIEAGAQARPFHLLLSLLLDREAQGWMRTGSFPEVSHKPPLAELEVGDITLLAEFSDWQSLLCGNGCWRLFRRNWHALCAQKTQRSG